MKPQTHVAWLTADEARQYLGFKTMNAFYTWKCRTRPKAYHLRGRLRFRQVDLDACVEPEPVERPARLRMVSR